MRVSDSNNRHQENRCLDSTSPLICFPTSFQTQNTGLLLLNMWHRYQCHFSQEIELGRLQSSTWTVLSILPKHQSSLKHYWRVSRLPLFVLFFALILVSTITLYRKPRICSLVCKDCVFSQHWSTEHDSCIHA